MRADLNAKPQLLRSWHRIIRRVKLFFGRFLRCPIPMVSHLRRIIGGMDTDSAVTEVVLHATVRPRLRLNNAVKLSGGLVLPLREKGFALPKGHSFTGVVQVVGITNIKGKVTRHPLSKMCRTSSTS